MMTEVDEIRRYFLQTLIGLAGYAVSQSFSWMVQQQSSRSLASSLAGMFSDEKGAALIGLEYLRNRPDEADSDRLVDLICSDRPERRSELMLVNERRRRDLLALQQREDFQYGRMVRIHGWILSETEARLCALAVLT